MRHRLDLINLQKPKIRLPAMGFEQRVMIRTEMSRCPLPVSGGVEHAAEAGRVDRPAVYTEADQAPRALVHDHEHPVTLEHDGLAAKQVDAPETVRRVTDERQPGRPGAARGGSIVFRQHASDDVLVDVDAERPRDGEMMRAMRGQPNRGFRDLSSTIARMSASLGPFGPGVLGRWLDENKRRYFRCTSAR